MVQIKIHNSPIGVRTTRELSRFYSSRIQRVQRDAVSSKKPSQLKRPTRTDAFRDVSAATTTSRRAISPRMLTIFGVGILSISTYCGYLYASYRQAVVQSKTLEVPEDVSDRYNSTATRYDAEVELGEKFMRLGKRRKELVQMARGDVLEVSCGTGRNMEYYRLGERRALDERGHAVLQGCRSATFVDLSPQMVEIARQKFRKLYPEFTKVAFRTEDAKKVIPTSASNTEGWKYSRPHFDTVIQTMGLCSTTDPVGLLQHLGSITEPQRGQVLLLEHGRSHYDWLNRILDNLAPAHAHRHGCWWNRDIGQIIEQSGLEVVEIRRYHLGTTWRAVLRPKRPDMS
ncbi:ubiquinone/menaquinone biosynthesis-related protein [Talaromyces stipitatus ATCC 10500]|uniref:Ubiquinone/menaquinone biosynthesis-related protein n=1 Tax=Talaromyces stipitatus (strain ATCC 10500 / CBS 375.48 / QM 6759 / NRRL 1006) TaxID=441959 RepID=B8M6Q8_TALSN|nr:ubiquinone/menaquinone biosynthesis-related protein [Talaromyces stipitatus ATCC 10500]EED19520.1 ubiquinone/menaquinone biosynthesis-related protein [Talaromyces stipitatus ATCC 10500]